MIDRVSSSLASLAIDVNRNCELRSPLHTDRDLNRTCSWDGMDGTHDRLVRQKP